MRKRGLLVASVGFIFGVLYGPGDLPWVDLIGGLLCFAIARRRQFRFPIMRSLFLGTGGFLLGLPVPAFLLPSPPALTAPATVEIEGIVVEAPDRGLLADGLVVDVTHPAPGRVLLRVPHGDTADHPPPCAAPGKRIRATVELSPRCPSLVPAFRSRRPAVRRGVELYGEVIGACTAVDPDSFDRSFLARAVASAIRRAAPKHGGMLAAFATGDRTGAELATEAAFVDAGLAHLFEFSGLAMALPFFLFRFALRSDRRRASQLAIPLLLALVFLFGATPSTIRCALLLACLLLPALSRGRFDMLDALALAAIVVLALSPAALGDVRFQLAFAGLSAALRLYPALAERIPHLARLPRTARAPIHLLLLAVAIALGTAPLAARLFDRVSLLSFVSTPFVLIAIIGIITPFAIAGGLLALVTPIAGDPFLRVAALLLDAVLSILPAPIATIPTPSVLECVLFYGLISTIAAPPSDDPKSPRRKIAFAVLSIVAFATSALFSAYRLSGDHLEAAILPASRGQTWAVRLADGSVVARDSSPPAAWFQMEQRLLSNHLKLHRKTAIDILYVDPSDDPATARELEHQFLVREKRPFPKEGLRFTHGSRSILFTSTASASADAIVLFDGTVMSGERTLKSREDGMIRIRIDEDRLEPVQRFTP